jgi:hypothetical protein
MNPAEHTEHTNRVPLTGIPVRVLVAGPTPTHGPSVPEFQRPLEAHARRDIGSTFNLRFLQLQITADLETDEEGEPTGVVVSLLQVAPSPLYVIRFVEGVPTAAEELVSPWPPGTPSEVSDVGIDPAVDTFDVIGSVVSGTTTIGGIHWKTPPEEEEEEEEEEE